MDLQKVHAACQAINDRIISQPTIGLILGSGLSELADELQNTVKIPYASIPHFPQTTVSGHKGQLVSGYIGNRYVLAMQGRFHYYEGYSMKQITFPIRVMKALGVNALIVTNAAGGIHDEFKPGDLMVIIDHINMFGSNPLIGSNNDAFGVRFPDMTKAYDPELINQAKDVAETLDIPLKRGVYVGTSGPMYETPAEIKMFQKLGGDAVGMSTIPEVIVARHASMRVLAISCIANMAAGLLHEELSHEAVIETTEQAKEKFKKLIRGILQTITL